MRAEPNFATRAGKLIFLGALFVCLQSSAQTLTNVNLRVMAANLTSGNDQDYQPEAIRIFQGLEPDIVAIQEFAYNNSSSSNNLRALVDTAFGAGFYFFCETNSPAYNIPNGIISRWPFTTNGSWIDSDTGVNDRGFAWAQIDLPGTNDLYVVSVHLKASNSGSDISRRAAQAAELKALIATNFLTNAWVVVAGDFNIASEAEAAVTTLSSFLSDKPVPADLGSDSDTNMGRNERYDRIYASFSFTNRLTPLVLPSRTLTNGLLFVSTNYTPLTDVAPVQFNDSNASNMQHHAVIKDFQIAYYLTNSSVTLVITNQPQAQAVTQGSSATFSVTAGGTSPLGYQWRFGGGLIGGATNSVYTRTNVQPSHVGGYSVVVSGSGAFITSSNALLSLIVPRPMLTTPYPGVVQWQGVSNLSYTIEFRTNLSQTNWQFLFHPSSPNNMITFSNLPIVGTQRYYRVTYP